LGSIDFRLLNATLRGATLYRVDFVAFFGKCSFGLAKWLTISTIRANPELGKRFPSRRDEIRTDPICLV
jgi:hypothetical protein